jgi:tRNA (cmo5U34)-methyltransferase
MEAQSQGAASAASAARPREDWHSGEFVSFWIDQQEERYVERHRQFVRIRSVIPKRRDEAFRYVNLGAGPGILDELLLADFPGASATLVDVAAGMHNDARRRLERFGNRVEYVQGDFATTAWASALNGPFDIAVSSIALHNLREANRIRALYAETHGLLADGGPFVNLDYVRSTSSAFVPVAAWAARDPEAEFERARAGGNQPGTVEEQLGWLREAGFTAADCPWKEWQVALMVGIRGQVSAP